MASNDVAGVFFYTHEVFQWDDFVDRVRAAVPEPAYVSLVSVKVLKAKLQSIIVVPMLMVRTQEKHYQSPMHRRMLVPSQVALPQSQHTAQRFCQRRLF